MLVRACMHVWMWGGGGGKEGGYTWDVPLCLEEIDGHWSRIRPVDRPRLVQCVGPECTSPLSPTCISAKASVWALKWRLYCWAYLVPEPAACMQCSWLGSALSSANCWWFCGLCPTYHPGYCGGVPRPPPCPRVSPELHTSTAWHLLPQLACWVPGGWALEQVILLI